MFTRLAAMLVFAVLFSGCFVRGGYYYRRPGYYPGYRAPGYGPGFRRPGYRPGRGPVIVVPPRGGRRPGRGGRPGGVIIVPKSAAITLPSTGFSALALNGATFSGAVFEHAVGIRFNGKERTDVEEYCISEGWVKVPAGKTLDRKGQPLLIKLKGQVEVYYKEA